MKKKILLITSLILLGIIAVAAISFNNMLQKSTSAYNHFNYGKLDLTTVEDGTYTGSEDGSIVKATVAVTVKKHIITNVKIISHDTGKGKPAEVIVNDIVKKNSLEVDTISGATYSSNVIKKAVYNALVK